MSDYTNMPSGPPAADKPAGGYPSAGYPSVQPTPYSTTAAQPGGYEANVMGAPSAPDAHPGNAYAATQPSSNPPASTQGGTYSQPPNQQAHQSTLDQVKGHVNNFGNQAQSFTKNLWGHLSTGNNAVHTAIGKIQNVKLLTPALAEDFWRKTFTPPPAPVETFVNYYSCHLSTSTGAVAGNLFVSTGSVAFISDRPLQSHAGSVQPAASYYKVHIPLNKIGQISEQSSQTNTNEKYIQIVTVDDHHFWFMGFISYDQAMQSLQSVLQQSKAGQGAPQPGAYQAYPTGQQGQPGSNPMAQDNPAPQQPPAYQAYPTGPAPQEPAKGEAVNLQAPQ